MTDSRFGLAMDRTVDVPDAIALRIVVDGATTAGKTTTARSLGEAFGRPVLSPAEEDGRTLLFDWLDHTAGNVDGRPIRTQLVAVPGHVPHLRARLLETADAVLFVADTSAAGMEASAQALAQVREVLSVLPEPRPGLVVQANKRDVDDALPMSEVVERLGIDDDALLTESVAIEGDGVRLAYVYAVRVGLARVRASTEERIAERQRTAEELLEQLDLDPRPASERTDVLATAPAPEGERSPKAPGRIRRLLDLLG